jgi:transposase
VRLRKTLVDERSAWLQRIHARLFHHGVPKASGLVMPARRERLTELELPDPARSVIATAALIDGINEQLRPLERELRSYARRQPDCLALQGHFGIGELTSVAILAELGDARRFSSSRHAVCFAGLDITASGSDQRRAAPPARSPTRGRRCRAGPCSRRPSVPAVSARPITPTTSTRASASMASGRR